MRESMKIIISQKMQKCEQIQDFHHWLMWSSHVQDMKKSKLNFDRLHMLLSQKSEQCRVSIKHKSSWFSHWQLCSLNVQSDIDTTSVSFWTCFECISVFWYCFDRDIILSRMQSTLLSLMQDNHENLSQDACRICSSININFESSSTEVVMHRVHVFSIILSFACVVVVNTSRRSWCSFFCRSFFT